EDIDALQFGNFGGDKAEHHEFSIRHALQRCERPGARIVVFEKIGVDLHRVEQRLRNGIVADVRLPVRILAAANVNPDAHSLRCTRGDGIDDADVGTQKIAPVIAALGEQLTYARIAELHQRRFVDLQIAATGVRERAHFLEIGFDQVGPEGVEVGIDIAADIGAPRTIMNVAWARERDLGRPRGQRLEKAKVVGVLWSLPGDAARQPLECVAPSRWPWLCELVQPRSSVISIFTPEMPPLVRASEWVPRRNSPSVTTYRPTSSWSFTTRAMAAFSIAAKPLRSSSPARTGLSRAGVPAAVSSCRYVRLGRGEGGSFPCA